MAAFVEPVQIDKGRDFQDINKHWFEFVRIASPDQTVEVRDYLESLCAEIIALEGVGISKVSVIISDSKHPNACVVDDNPDHTIISITRGLLDYVDSEDELFGIMGHEIGHALIEHKFGKGRNSRPEEIGADGFGAYALIKTGRNWKALQTFFIKLSESEKKYKNQITRVEQVKHEIMDVHSTARERAQHVQTFVGSYTLKKQCEIPDPEERKMPERIVELAKNIKHISYMDRLLELHGYDDMGAGEQLEFLSTLDRQHYGWFFIPKDKRQDESAQKEIALEREARELRRDDFSKYTIKALKRFDKEKGGNFTAKDKALLNRVIDAAGYYNETLPFADEDGQAFKLCRLSVYKTVSDMLGGRDTEWLPLGSQMPVLFDRAEKLVGADSYETALETAEQLKKEISRHVTLGYPVRLMEHGVEDKYFTLELAYLFRHIHFSHFSGEEKEGEPLPWAQHIDWAKQDESGVIAEMLWRIGINKDKDLWAAIHPTALKERLDQWNFTQPAGALKKYSVTEYNKGDRNKDGSITVSVVDYKQRERFKRYAEKELQKHRISVTLEVPEFKTGTLSTALPEFVLEHEGVLSAPLKNRPGQEHFFLPDFDLDPAIHINRTKALLDRITTCLAEGNPDDREAVRAFFLGGYRYSNVPVACLSWLKKDWDGIYGTEYPFAKFIQEDPFALFSKRERAGLLFATSCYTLGDASYDREKMRGVYDLAYWREAYGYGQPENYAALVALSDDLKILDEPCKGKSIIDETARDIGDARRVSQKKNIFEKEFDALLKTSNIELLSSDFAQIVAFYLENEKPSMSGYLPASLRRQIQTLIQGDYEDTQDVVLNLEDKEISSDALIDIYCFFDHEGVFPNLEYKVDFGKEVLSRIAGEDNIYEQAKLLEKLIFSRKTDTNSSSNERPLSDFSVSGRAIKAWANAMAHIYGIDDGSVAYREKMAPLIERIKTSVPERDRHDVYRALADEIISQRDLSYDMADALQLDRKDFEMADVPIRGVEKLLDYMRQDPETRGESLDFFMSMENDETIDKLTDKLIVWMDEDLSSRKATIAFQLGVVTFAELNTSDEEATALLMSDEFNKKLKDKLNATSRELHRYFWSRNLDIRTVFVNYLLLSSDELLKDPEAANAQALKLTLDKLFPEESLDPTEQLRNDWSREFLQVFLENSHEAERSLIMSALISSAQTDRLTGETQGFGERLAGILGMLGPAYYKLGQGIHSHPRTPEDIRDPLADLKSLGEKSTRWAYWKRIDKTVPQAVRSMMSWVGDIVGKASFFTAGSVEMKDGRTLMLGLLGEGAEDEAKHGFNRLEACAKTLAQRNSDFANISHTLISMIAQARDLVDVETDLHLGAKQSMYMQKLYEGLSVEMDGYAFHYDPKIWRYYGDEFKLMDIAQGVHFDELPEATAEEQAFKKARAKSDSLVELMHKLGGDRFDDDRHERQSRQSGSVVGVFDPGGMLLEKPTDNDKKMLVGALKAILPEIMSPNGSPDAAASAITKYLADMEERTGLSCPDYLMHIQKALLALNGVHRCLETKDFKDILGALVKGNYVDPKIRNPLAFQMAGLGLVNGGLSSLMKKSSIKITKPDHVDLFQPVYVPNDSDDAVGFVPVKVEQSAQTRFPAMMMAA